MRKQRPEPTALRMMIVTLAVVALLAGCRRTAETPTAGGTSTTTDATAAPATGTAPPASGPSIKLSANIPGDADFGNTVSLPAIQQDFDIFSWNSFISLNWPPGPDGRGDPAKKIGENGDNPTVWEEFRDVQNVFLAGGATPTWDGPVEVPAECKALYTPGTKFLSQVGKTPTVLTAMSQPFNTGPLIDQNGVFTRFEIVINKPMFDYILANSLYSKAGQKAFTGPVKFPCGSSGPTGNEGAILLKASWKVIDPSEKDRFHTSETLVYSPASKNPKYPASCSKQLVGLVGLHIVHKTNSASQWLWSTFEHIDNAPTEADVASGKLKAKYNYFNPKCSAADCPPNQTPPRPWDPTKVSNAFHTQVVRINSFKGNEFAAESAAEQNAAAWKQLGGVNPKSVWQNYELISTQWPTDTGKCAPTPGNPLGTPAPNFLANTTLETYVQGMVPNVSSSCMSCHNNATTTTGMGSDFTYVLERAK